MSTAIEPRAHARSRLGKLTPLLNPIVLRLARFIPVYVVLEHRGRRSGRIYRSPLAGVRTANGFVIPIAFGEGSHWVRNVIQAGGGKLEWRGRRFEIAEPEVISWDEGKGALTALERRLAPVFGVSRFVRVKAEPAPRSPA
ncbi:MAG TPA: nitroreductase/quinone reductase family protein [Candidatus Dormibacteraeota bacterium]